MEHLRARAWAAQPRTRHHDRSAAARHPERRQRGLLRSVPRDPGRRARTAASVRQELLQERTAVRLAGRNPGRPRRAGTRGHPPRPARAHLPSVDPGRAPYGHSGGLHGSRLLAGLLLVRSDSHARRAGPVPRLFRRDDGAMHPASRRSRMAGGTADDSVHAAQPCAEAARPGWSGRGHCRQLDDRRRSPRSCPGARRRPDGSHSKSGRPSRPARARRRLGCADRRTVCPVSGQARSEQGHESPRPRRESRRPAMAADRRRRRSRSAARSKPRPGEAAATSDSPAGSIRPPRPPGWRMPRCSSSRREAPNRSAESCSKPARSVCRLRP